MTIHENDWREGAQSESSLRQAVLFRVWSGASRWPCRSGWVVGLAWLSGSGVTAPKSRVM